MTIVEGQIETLKRLKESLRKNGVTRFTSIGEIRAFLDGFELEEKQLPIQIERDVDANIRTAQQNIARYEKELNELEMFVRNSVQKQLHELFSELKRVREKKLRSSFFKGFYFLKHFLIARKASRLDKNLEKTIRRKTKSDYKKVAKQEKDLKRLLANRDNLVSTLCKDALKELVHTKQVVDELYPLVAGAIGEAAVVKTLRQLSNDYYLINDFSMRFKRPIYNKKEKDRIYSIQIDHLLVCKAGIFLLETKNWSKASIENLDLRSPIKQVLRTGFALYVWLNNDSRRRAIKLSRHHWGVKDIPVRNLIVMINSKPQAEFRHVKVLSLSELLGYIKYFDPIFDRDDVSRVFEYLKRNCR